LKNYINTATIKSATTSLLPKQKAWSLQESTWKPSTQ